MFLENLYNSLYYKKDNGERVHLKNGVPQGSILSPLLFDIYMDEVMKEILSDFKEKIFKKLYADDLVGITKFKHIKAFIDISKKVF